MKNQEVSFPLFLCGFQYTICYKVYPDMKQYVAQVIENKKASL